MDELFSEQSLHRSLAPRPFRFYAQCQSTNDLAQQWALEGAFSGSVVVTEEQVSGRGRFARRWIAPPGTALLFSMVLHPRLSAARLARLTMVGAVAVAECLDELVPGQVAIKWPNDVQLAGRKVAGNLPEGIWQNDQLFGMILGIGLNVRIDFAGTELAKKAVSIESVTGTAVNRAALLNKLLRRIDYWSVRVEDASLFAAWRARLNTLGQHVTATAGDAQASYAISGVASDVDEDGALLLTTDDGRSHRVIAGEVTLDTGNSG